MCGIIGYNGREAAEGRLLGGLRRLEYRGYDSAGAAVLNGEGLHIRRAAGRVDALAEVLRADPLPEARLGIAHTRWATHGAPTKENAHPHRCGRVALVHNGILENYGELKAELLADGRRFTSETDTEVIAHLLDLAYEGDALAAIRTAVSRLRGSYALAILFSDREDVLFGVRCGSPLIVGYGEGETLLASDLPAIRDRTCRYTPMGEGEIVCVHANGAEFFSSTGERISKEILTARGESDGGDKGDHACFLEKEMAEQAEAVRRTLAPHLSEEIPFRDSLPDGRELHRVIFLACGSAMHACLCGKRFFERMARIPCDVYVASEFRYCDPILEDGTLAVAVSQSGETADTLAALRLCRERGIPTVGIVNVTASTLAAEADAVIPTLAGTEIAVATTKAYTAQVALLAQMACRLARDRGKTPSLTLSHFRALPEGLAQAEGLDGECAAIAERIKDSHDIFFIGRGRDLAVCMEGALKLKEISYLHCEAYAAGELKHGTISLIHTDVPVLALITDGALKNKTVGNMKECRARGAYVILLVSRELAAEIPTDAYDACISVPGGLDELSVLPAAAVMQRIAYHTARLLDRDVDKPRNLAKSVTVE